MGKKNESSSKGRTVYNQPADSDSVPGVARPDRVHRRVRPIDRPVGDLPLGIELVDYDQKVGIVYAAIHLDRADNDLRILTSLVNSLNDMKRNK